MSKLEGDNQVTEVGATRADVEEAKRLIASGELAEEVATLNEALRESIDPAELRKSILEGNLEVDTADAIRALGALEMDTVSRTLLMGIALSDSYDTDSRELSAELLAARDPEIAAFLLAVTTRTASPFDAEVALERLLDLDKTSAERLEWETGDTSISAPPETAVSRASLVAEEVLTSESPAPHDVKERILDAGMENPEFALALYAGLTAHPEAEMRVLALEGLSGLNLSFAIEYAESLRDHADRSGVKARQLLESFGDVPE